MSDPTPQPAHDHGAAGFCTDHGQPSDERTETVAEPLDALRERVAAALYDGNEAFHAALAHERGQEYQRISRPSWVDTHEYYRALYLARADAALAVRDAEVERLRGSADAWWAEYDRELTAHEATKAEVERLTRIVNGYDRTPAERRAADAEAERDSARAEVEHLRAVQQAIGECRDDPAKAIVDADRIAGEHIVRALDAENHLAAARAALDRVRALADLMAHGPDRSGEPPLVTQAWTNAADAILAAIGPRDHRTFLHCGFAESHEPHADRDTYCDGSNAGGAR